MSTSAQGSTTAYRPRHVPALDGIRGLAVLIVFFFHYAGGTHSSFLPLKLFGIVNKGGWSGVVLFFVLSGFLITGILWDSFEDPHWWRKFFARRSLRIFPLYYLALGIVWIAAATVGTGAAAGRVVWVPALFLENFPHLSILSESMASPLGMYHLWSIAVEEQFYLLWPWLLYFFARRRTPAARDHAKWLCAAVFLLSIFFRALIWRFAANPDSYAHFLPTQAGALAAGGWVALAYRGPEWHSTLRAAPLALSVGLAGFLAAGILSHRFDADGSHMMTYGLPLVTLGFAGVLALTLTAGVLARGFAMGWLRWLGNISYGVYVFHVLLRGAAVHIAVVLVGGRGLMAVNAVQFVVGAFLSLAAAWASYHLFEKQFLRLKRYFIPQVGA